MNESTINAMLVAATVIVGILVIYLFVRAHRTLKRSNNPLEEAKILAAAQAEAMKQARPANSNQDKSAVAKRPKSTDHAKPHDAPERQSRSSAKKAHEYHVHSNNRTQKH